jgi:23S rRNA (cytidine2498-2'-O)-methyltransferase
MTTTNTQQWLIYCRPGFERDCVEESQAKPIQVIENAGFVVLQGKPHLNFKQLTFARQLLDIQAEVYELPERDRLTPLLAAIPDFPSQFSALYLEVPDTNEGKMLSGFTRRFQPLIEEKLQTSLRLKDDPALPRLHIFFPNNHHALICTSDIHNSTESLNGIHRVSMAKDAPSRSYLKLTEAFEVFLDKSEQAQLLKPGMTAVDLGAAPGGWTWQLAQRGLKVTAVDNGPLKGAAANHPSIKHLRQDGFRFRPQRPVDWLVCDMIEQPQRVATLMTEWLIGGFTQRAIFNLKLPMKKRVTALNDALSSMRKALDAKGIRYRLEAKQLYHDREEVTIFLARKR